MMDYDKICENVIAELTDKNLVTLRENSPDFSELMEKQADRLDSLQATFSAEQYGQVAEFATKENELSFIKLQHIYMAGALDCVKLLKQLGVI